MRKLLFLVLLITATVSYGQIYDSVIFTKVQINGIFCGSKKEAIIKKFGEPHKTITTENNKGADIFIDYQYDKSTLRINPAGVFNGFKLTNDRFLLRYLQHTIKVGDSIKEFAIYFPNSFNAYSKDVTGKFKLKIRQSLNAYIVVKTKEGVVTQIATWEDPD